MRNAYNHLLYECKVRLNKPVLERPVTLDTDSYGC